VLTKAIRPNAHAQRENGGEWQTKLSDKIVTLHQVRS
jgi:hypothetical protein